MMNTCDFVVMGGGGGVYLRRVQIQCTFHARRHAREDNSGVTLESLCATVHHGDNGAGVQFSIIVSKETDLTTETEKLVKLFNHRADSHNTNNRHKATSEKHYTILGL